MTVAMAFTPFSVAIFALVSLIYLLGLCIYRLYLHPLAKVPGPTLAALTGWYEAYFELFHKGLGGQYTFHIKELHERYGPIVRINPLEVHIDDPNFYSTIYTNREGLDKPQRLKWRFGSPSALFSTPEHRIHRMRRAAQDPFFAKGRILKFSPLVQAKATQMCARLAKDFANQGRPVTLDNMFASYIADVTTQYSFNRDYNWLGHPEFKSPFLKTIEGFMNIAHPCTQFPWLARALTAIPDSVVRILQPSMSVVIEFQNEMRKMVRNAQEDLQADKNASEQALQVAETIFHGILRADLPEEEMEMEILKDQAVSLLGAGIASAETTLKVAAFHIMNNRTVYRNLKNELEAAIPDSLGLAPLDKVLERLPYLTACVEEAIRLACGQMTRSPRVSKNTITYGDYALPAGTHISLDTWHIHHNEVLYPFSFTYIPERWLNQPMSPPQYGKRPLKSFMTSFGRGTRNCMGINLAYAEITIALASLFRRFEWDLYETTEEDIRVVRDLVAPEMPKNSKGIRALVKEIL